MHFARCWWRRSHFAGVYSRRCRWQCQTFGKDEGIIAGVDFARKLFEYVDRLEMMKNYRRHSQKYGDVVFMFQGCHNHLKSGA